MPWPFLPLSVVPDREHVCVVADGEIDLATGPILDAQLAELWASGWERVAVDLRAVAFMDSAGVHVLLRHDLRARERGGRLTVIAGAGPISSVLALTAADRSLLVAVA